MNFWKRLFSLLWFINIVVCRSAFASCDFPYARNKIEWQHGFLLTVSDCSRSAAQIRVDFNKDISAYLPQTMMAFITAATTTTKTHKYTEKTADPTKSQMSQNREDYGQRTQKLCLCVGHSPLRSHWMRVWVCCCAVKRRFLAESFDV